MNQLDIFSYHNTNNLVGAELQSADASCKGQEADILSFFRARIGMYLTPEDASAALSVRTPLTSVRRAISNLTEKGLLRKTACMRNGKYGKPIHHWIYESEMKKAPGVVS